MTPLQGDLLKLLAVEVFIGYLFGKWITFNLSRPREPAHPTREP